MRYELLENPYKSARNVGDKGIATLLKNLNSLVLIAYNAINGFLINSKRNAIRDRLIFLPLTIIFIGLSIIRGSRTGFVMSIIAFIVGLYYGTNIEAQNIEDDYIKKESNLLKYLKREKKF